MQIDIAKVAPYLSDPLVLIGFALFLSFLFVRVLVKRGLIPVLSKSGGYQILKLILMYGFILGLLVILLGFALKYQEIANQQVSVASIVKLINESKVETPLTPEEKDKFKAKVLYLGGLFRLNPQAQPKSTMDNLESNVKAVTADERYEKEMPTETSMLYRLYAASTFLFADPNLALDVHLEKAYSYIEKSYRLDPAIWAKPQEKASYEFFRQVHTNKNKAIGKDEFLASTLALTMIGADEPDVQDQTNDAKNKLEPCLGKPRADFIYFKEYKGNGSQKLSYNTYIATLKIAIVGEGGDFQGPFMESTEGCKTLIKYIMSPKDKPQAIMEWIVQKDHNLIEPRTIYAKEIHGLVVR